MEELEQDSEKWVCYLKEHNFEIILPDIIIREIISLLTENEETEIWKNKEKHFLRLIKSGQKFEFKHIKAKHETEYYYRQAKMMIKKHYLNSIQKSKGLYQVISGREMYFLHMQDLAIFISLKELGGPYYFITHDTKLKEALKEKEIKDILISEGICFILLHETQRVKDRSITRVKVMPEY